MHINHNMNHNMNPFTIHIIASYLQPNLLTSFLIRNNNNNNNNNRNHNHNHNHNHKTSTLKYNASYYNTTLTHITNLLQCNQSIILTGINLTHPHPHPPPILFTIAHQISHLILKCVDDYKLDLSEFIKLKHIKLTGCSYVNINAQKCTKLKSFQSDGFITNMNNLLSFPNIRSICATWDEIKIVKKFKKIKKLKLSINTPNIIINLSNFPKLTHLHVLGNSTTELRSFNHLKSLTLVHCINLNNLSNMPYLHTLRISECDGHTMISNYKNLKILQMRCVTKNLDFLKDLIHLREVTLHYCSGLTNLDGLNDNIEVLILDGSNYLFDFYFLDRMKNLKRFEMYECGSLFVAKHLYVCNKLERLRLSTVNINMCNMQNAVLRSIELCSCWGTIDFMGFNLRRLVLVNCSLIINIEQILKNNTNIEELIVKRMNVGTDVDMGRMKMLKILELSNLCELEKIVNLEHCNLHSLKITWCDRLVYVGDLSKCYCLDEEDFKILKKYHVGFNC